MTKQNELKPCPFCGGTKLITKIPNFSFDTYVLCLSCQAEAKEDQWNTRTIDPVLKEVEEALDQAQHTLEQCVKIEDEQEDVIFNAHERAVKALEKLRALQGGG